MPFYTDCIIHVRSNKIKISPYPSRFDRHKDAPLCWHNKASDLRGAAGVLWASMDKKRSAEIVDELGLGAGFSLNIATYPVYLMLCGMALELLYKSIIVTKQEEPIPSHNLIAVSEQAGLELSKTEKGLVQILSEYIMWSGRYPVPKKEANLLHLHDLTFEHLYEPSGLDQIQIMKPNHALDWASFNELWDKANNVYWKGNS